jgi:hypothetical protein
MRWGATSTQRNDRLLPAARPAVPDIPADLRFWSPRSGFEPTTFRLRVGRKPSAGCLSSPYVAISRGTRTPPQRPCHTSSQALRTTPSGSDRCLPVGFHAGLAAQRARHDTGGTPRDHDLQGGRKMQDVVDGVFGAAALSFRSVAEEEARVGRFHAADDSGGDSRSILLQPFGETLLQGDSSSTSWTSTRGLPIRARTCGSSFWWVARWSSLAR